MAFRLTPLAVDAGAAVALQGEVDMAVAGELEEALLRWIETTEGSLTIDVSELRFIDSTGLRALVNVRQAAEDEDRSLKLRNPGETVARVLEVTRLDEVLLDPA